MNQLGGFPLLTLVVFLPLLGALISLFVPSDRRESLHSLAFLVAIADLFISLFLYMGWVNDPLVTTQFVDGPLLWIAGLGIHYHLGVDGINLYLVLLATLLTPLAMLAGSPSTDDPGASKGTVFWILVFETGALGALTALDMVLFSVFWLLTLLAACFLIGENAQNPRAMTHLWTAAALGGVLLSAVTVALSASQSSFDLADLSTASIPWQTQGWLFWGIVSAFGIAGAVFPLHLPLARALWQQSHPNRPASPVAQILISSLILDLAGYGLIRFCLCLFPATGTHYAPLLVVLGTVGMVYGAVAALGQRDLCGTLAYWNVSQMGLALAGIFSLQNLGLHGAVTQLLAHSLSVAALFLIGGSAASHGQRQPAHTQSSGGDRTALALAFLSAIGLPGTIGFLGQGLTGLGLVGWLWDGFAGGEIQRWLLLGLLGVGALIGAWALLRAWRSSTIPASGRISRRTVLALPILFSIFLLGMRPMRSWDIVGPSVHRVLQQVRSEAQTNRFQTTSAAPTMENAKVSNLINDLSHPSGARMTTGASWEYHTAVSVALANKVLWPGASATASPNPGKSAR